ncbi:crossover junction endodeoxyribonuclease RuvC [Patescibacteria group bacterium]
MTTSKKSAQTVILGIDPGYGRLGYAVLEKTGSKEILLDYSCVVTNPKDSHGKRILAIAKEIEKVIKKHKPDVLAIEKLFFTKNQKTALAVSEVKGVVIYLATKNDLQIAEYTPLEIKSSVCGYGKADKEQIKKMVDLIIKPQITPKYDDTYDAIAICLTHSSHFGNNK